MAAGRHIGFDPTGNGAVRSAVPNKIKFGRCIHLLQAKI